MRKSSRRKNGTLRRQCAALYEGIQVFTAQLFHDIVNELQLLNSARMGKSELSRLSSRQAAQAVKAVLCAHHRDRPRCC